MGDVDYVRIFLAILESARTMFGQSDINMPNVEFPTMGGKVFWDTVDTYMGFKLQTNKLTGHARVLKPDNNRIAWGSENAMRTVFERFKNESR